MIPSSILQLPFAIGMPGTGEMIMIGAILLLMFGGAKLPQLARSLGQSIVEFKKGVKGEEDGDPALPPGDEKKALPNGDGDS